MKEQLENVVPITSDLKSDSMNEMLSSPPSWIIRSGSGLFLMVLLIVVGLAWFIRYPDEVSGDIVVTTSNPPIELSNQGYIQLKSLNVQENEKVRSGDLIAQFDIQANAEDVEKASAYLNKLEVSDAHFPTEIVEFDQKLQLGVFQEQWTALLSKIHEWNLKHSENLSAKELVFIQQEISFREQLQAISGKRIKLSEEEYAMIEEQLAGSERLAEQQAISKQTLAQDKRLKSQAMQTVHSQKEQYVQNQITLNALRKQKLQMEHDGRLEELQHAADIRMNLVTLRNSIQNWEKNAVWIAPCSGKVLFNKILQVNRFYKVNEASLVIVPEGSGYSALATIQTAGAGKVRVGQKTFIELVDFPKSEFGLLEGIVSSMTQIDKAGKYEVKIELLHQLKTTYNKHIPAKAQLKGKVKIITKDKRLLMRFFEQLTDLIK